MQASALWSVGMRGVPLSGSQPSELSVCSGYLGSGGGGVVPLGEFAFMAHGLSLLNQSIVREYHAQSNLFEFSKLLGDINKT
jgi:hypothetical protein